MRDRVQSFTELGVTIPADVPSNVGSAGPPSDSMTYCRDFDGQAFIYSQTCHAPGDFYAGSYYKVRKIH